MDDSDWYSAEVYVRGTNLLAKFSKQSGGVKTDYQYYTQNAHGDVVNLTDSTGAITKSYKYDAFGVEQNIDDADANAFRYCGEYYDAETGTIYLRARYYNPTTGRFISRDSYAGKNEDPLSLNLYTYCHNNPVLYIDPSGHLIWPGQIHDAVQNDIVYGDPYTNYSDMRIPTSSDSRDLVKEVKISYGNDAKKYFGKKSGRADIVDKLTGEVWEVKSDYSGKGLTEAKHDIDGYIMAGNKYKSKLKLNPDLYTKSIDPEAKSVNGTTPIIGGIDENMNGSFVYRAGAYEYYDVTYWQPEEGVILYNYSRKKLNAEEMAYETLLILLLASAAYSGSGVGQPAPAMQPAI